MSCHHLQPLSLQFSNDCSRKWEKVKHKRKDKNYQQKLWLHVLTSLDGDRNSSNNWSASSSSCTIGSGLAVVSSNSRILTEEMVLGAGSMCSTCSRVRVVSSIPSLNIKISLSIGTIQFNTLLSTLQRCNMKLITKFFLQMLKSLDKETLIAIEEWSIDSENICAIFRISSFVSIRKKVHVHFWKTTELV